MKIEPRKISIRKLIEGYEGYEDNEAEGVVGLGGDLDIRPPYQRNFIYKPKQREAVIKSVLEGFPLNSIYWGVNSNDSDGKRYEVLDGQQRILSICEFTRPDGNGDSINLMDSHDEPNPYYFHSLDTSLQEKILNYELMVYFCEGTPLEKLKWFKRINIKGLELTNQEVLNATYVGPWVTSAKKDFSKISGPAWQIGRWYVPGPLDRQKYLETAIRWISNNDVVGYMSKHRQDSDSDELWEHFESVINWIEKVFTVRRKNLMTKVPWGELYNKYSAEDLDPIALEAKIKELVKKEQIKNKSGIYYYVLDGDKNHLDYRLFTDGQKWEMYERQDGLCGKCNKPFEFEKLQGHHDQPWSEKGKTDIENGIMLCKKCHKEIHK